MIEALFLDKDLDGVVTTVAVANGVDILKVCEIYVCLADGSLVKLKRRGDEECAYVDENNIYEVLLSNSGLMKCKVLGEENVPTISEVRFSLSLIEPHERCFKQGYQSWNLNKTFEPHERRVKSLVSRWIEYLPGMMKDSDHPTWKDPRLTKRKGMDSFDLAGFSNKKSTILIGACTCKMGQTAFWIYSGKTNFFKDLKMSISFGNHSKSPGEALSETLSIFYATSGNQAEALLQSYALKCQQLQNKFEERNSPILKLGRAPSGLCSWYQFHQYVKNEDIDRMLEEISRSPNLAKSIDVVQLDDGYQLNTGDWLETRNRFNEKDLSKVAKRIKSTGKLAGLWVAPFFASKTSKLAKRHPDWLLDRVDRNGKVVGHIEQAWQRGMDLQSMIQYCLDLSHPEVLTHLEKTFRELGEHWDYFKLDFLAAGMREGARYNASITRVEAYINGLNAIRRGCGASKYLLGCGAPILASMQSGTFDAMRVTCDTYSSWKQPFWIRSILPDYENLPSCETSLWGNMTRIYMHKCFWQNDPDCLILRKRGSTMTYNQILMQATVLSLTGGLLIISDDLETLEAERLEIALKIMPSSSLTASTQNLILSEKPDVFTMKGESGFVKAYFNWSSKKLKRQIPMDYCSFEFWSETICTTSSWTHAPYEPCVLQYPKGDCLLLGTTLHLTAIADGRIKAVNETANGEVVCTVSGDDSLAMHHGKLAFAISDLELISAEGVKAWWNEEDKRILELEILEHIWSLKVKRTA